MKKLLWIGITVALVNAFAANARAGEELTLAGIVSQSGGEGQFDTNPFDYDLLLNSVIAAELVDALSDPAANYTLFAPNDLAFLRTARALGFKGSDEAQAFAFLVAALTELDPNGDPIALLTQILLYHVVDDEIDVFGFIIASIFRIAVETLQGGEIQPNFFSIGDNDPDLRDPKLFFPLNVRASNGIIHTINRILIPIDIP